MTDLAKYLSTKQVAQRCGVHRKTIARWVDAGVLPAVYTTGGHRRLLAMDVERFLQHRRNLHAVREEPTAGFCVLVSTDSSLIAALQNAVRGLSQDIHVRMVAEVFDAGLVAGTLQPRLILVDESVAGCDPATVGAAVLRRQSDGNVVACLETPTKARRAQLAINGVRAVLTKPVSTSDLRLVLEMAVRGVGDT